ncbi:MIOREX complex component 10 [Candida viswanathii]|uniref:MIOREX complex component 10 n=1 Tax=Candida viswanathii TaxID=5486 RepID=A0A367XVZ0_9ASCO|nr:MIOREX complex component 10 [Candida viswanathii]
MIKRIPRTIQLIRFPRLSIYRFNSTAPVIAENRPVKRAKNVPKKKFGAQKLRRTEDSQFHNESTNYILSLLNENRQEDVSPKVLEKYFNIVTSLTVGDAIDFDKLIPNIQGYEFQIVIPEEVINISTSTANLMILSNGTLVGWNLTEDEIIQYLPVIEASIENKFTTFESEEIDWIELTQLPEKPLHKGNSYLHGEIMVVQGSNKEQRLLDMAAFAIGLSRSTRLSILETQLEEYLNLTKQNSEILADGKQITTSEHEFLKITGKLFLLRGKLNLYSELIDTPDLYWSEPKLEKIYNSISKILDINSRISIMNRKLDYATDEQRALLSLLSEKKGTRLEWIIIWLILIEVCFETFHFYEKYEGKNSNVVKGEKDSK